MEQPQNTNLSQTESIKEALTVAIRHNLISARFFDKTENINTNNPVQLYKAFDILVKSRCRAKLKKLGVEFPTKKTWEDHLEIETSNDGWTVFNRTKETQYKVTEEGFRLNCTCDSYGTGYCKHRDAVEHLRCSRVESVLRQDITATPITKSSLKIVSPSHLPELLPGFTPTKDQWVALESIKKWWSKTSTPFFRLEGFAGTGKSTIIQAFIKWLKPREPLTKIAFAAPTNKATKIQRKMLANWDLDGIDPKTCAQLFGIRAKTVEGKQIFSVDPKEEPSADQYDLMIIDEISMINEELWGYFLDKSQEFYPRSHRFILMGDRAQLPPIGESESQTFTHDCNNASLTEVKRYQGAIGELANSLRNNLESPVLPMIEYSPDECGESGVWATEAKLWDALVVKAFTSENSQKNADYCRVLAWRNARVSYLNAKIRKALGRSGEFQVGDRIIAKEPFINNGFTVLPNSEEAEVIEVVNGSVGGWQVWFLTLSIEGQLAQPIIPVLKQSYKAKFDAQLKVLSSEKKWGSFWRLKGQFANVDYSYCLTIHKSQGSSFTNGFVDLADISRCRSRNISQKTGKLIYERNQLAYVAVTRFEKRLFILQ